MAAGAFQLTKAVPSPAVPVTPVGLSGTPAGVTVLEGFEARPGPAPLVAVTVNVYAWPFVSPETVQLVAPVVAHVFPSGALVTR